MQCWSLACYYTDFSGKAVVMDFLQTKQYCQSFSLYVAVSPLSNG